MPQAWSVPASRCCRAGITWLAVVAANSATAGGDGLRATPGRIVLRGPDAVQQLVVEAAEGPDLTGRARFESADPTVADVGPDGLVSARGEGETAIRVAVGGSRVEVPVQVREYSPGPPIHFANHVVPIFTKLGCNAGGCHGKSSGQNGFRLSLLGFEPGLDYETLVKEDRGRRLFPAAPERSLLLLKAVATLPHGGGKKLDPDSHEYRLLVRWIAAGMPVGREDAPTVVRIEVTPAARVLERGGSQQVLVTAHYSDGATEDVTRSAQYQSNETEVATVAEAGRVEARQLAGQAAIMARYQGQVAVCRVTVPLGKRTGDAISFRPANFVDEHVLTQWRALGIEPSGPCSDAEFLRRAALDICGTMPAGDEVRAFVADADPEKRARLIDRLLERPEYAAFFATKWAEILRNKREGNAQLQAGTHRFHDWIRESLAENLPYDAFARRILAASGTPATAPAVLWYRKLRSPDAFVDDTAQVFLGMRLQCARCHHHPFERWSQDDYYGFAAFFARIGRKPVLTSRWQGRPVEEAIFAARAGSVSNPKTGQVLPPKGLGAEVVPVASTEDPRQKLVDWMADPKNPYFARALVNRYWAHFFGRGIVEPMDDMRLTNPPSNPELLDALAADFVASRFDLKHLVRTLCTSRVYGLSSLPNDSNAQDRQSFARHYPKRLPAEVLLDAISLVSGAPTKFDGLPESTRAIDLPDEGVGSSFLDTFGRPRRDSACECERVADASLGQSLLLINSNELQSKLASRGSRAESLAQDPRPDNDKVADLFWTAFGRAPTSSEAAAALDYLGRHADGRPAAYQDIIWALLNAKEFQFNR
jgi:hypothetical protein